VWGTIVMFIANSWLTYMMSPPASVTADTPPSTIDLWVAITNATWMPINIHRLIANVVFGGAIVAAYASYRFLAATSDEERAHYDWMGYVGNFIAIAALIVLPFAGYWLGREIYEFDQSMGITMMGGFMSWLWVIQAFLIAVLFLAGNYYLWLGMDRIPGAERFRPYTKWLLAVLVVGAIVWGTPHTMIASSKELAAMGGSHHPFLGVLGVMSAKNTAVNLMILTTFLSFLLYRRANKLPTVAWARTFCRQHVLWPPRWSSSMASTATCRAIADRLQRLPCSPCCVHPGDGDRPDAQRGESAARSAGGGCPRDRSTPSSCWPSPSPG
jgi:hypothetical protein